MAAYDAEIVYTMIIHNNTIQGVGTEPRSKET